MVVMKGGREIAPSFLPHLRLSFHGEREKGREREREDERDYSIAAYARRRSLFLRRRL